MTAAAKRWQVHIAGWARSGLSCKEYAAQVGVHPGTLAAWKPKLRQAGGAVPTFVLDPMSVPRVARARGMTEPDLQASVDRHTEDRAFGLLGEPRVNVLLLTVSSTQPPAELPLETPETTPPKASPPRSSSPRSVRVLGSRKSHDDCRLPRWWRGRQLERHAEPGVDAPHQVFREASAEALHDAQLVDGPHLLAAGDAVLGARDRGRDLHMERVGGAPSLRARNDHRRGRDAVPCVPLDDHRGSMPADVVVLLFSAEGVVQIHQNVLSPLQIGVDWRSIIWIVGFNAHTRSGVYARAQSL